MLEDLGAVRSAPLDIFPSSQQNYDEVLRTGSLCNDVVIDASTHHAAQIGASKSQPAVYLLEPTRLPPHTLLFAIQALQVPAHLPKP